MTYTSNNPTSGNFDLNLVDKFTGKIFYNQDFPVNGVPIATGATQVGNGDLILTGNIQQYLGTAYFNTNSFQLCNVDLACP